MNTPTQWAFNRKTLRIPITIIDEETGEPKEIKMRSIMTTISLVGYGQVWHYSKSNRGNSVLDSRDNKRKPSEYIASELRRLLGDSEGEKAYNTLAGV